MQLRIFYLEERLSKLNSNTSDDSEDLAQENLDLKMLVEEKQRDLEDRNQLLVKARNAIEGTWANGLAIGSYGITVD